jgi:hypothetical protein
MFSTKIKPGGKMKTFKEIKESKEIVVIEDGFKEMVLAGVSCSCKARVVIDQVPQDIVADYYIEVSHP